MVAPLETGGSVDLEEAEAAVMDSPLEQVVQELLGKVHLVARTASGALVDGVQVAAAAERVGRDCRRPVAG
jgi:hypothetical protein